jgi:hypothetical protein
MKKRSNIQTAVGNIWKEYRSASSLAICKTNKVKVDTRRIKFSIFVLFLSLIFSIFGIHSIDFFKMAMPNNASQASSCFMFW